jgi:8-oxo-dGTP diphosphatase
LFTFNGGAVGRIHEELATMESATARAYFKYALPESRLGTEHKSLDDFRRAAGIADTPANVKERCEKHYTLVVVTEWNSRRVLLGRKHRGFGEGMVNSFGGKVEEETASHGAIRELLEETGIEVKQVETMDQARVGTLRFTFEDSSTEMVVHLFRIRVKIGRGIDKLDNHSDCSTIVTIDDENDVRGCDEITPFWIDDWSELPLDNMFADDSLWLTCLLASDDPLLVDGYFSFCAGGQEVNSIRHYYMDIRPKEMATLPESSSSEKYTLEQRLFHALHDNKVHSPTLKEFKEAYAFVNAVRSVFGSGNRDAFDCIIDVAGGHGALAALFLVTTNAKDAVVVDPARVGSGGVQRAWGSMYTPKPLRFRHECLRTGLRAELHSALQATARNRILVVACHACQHLSDEVLEISCQYGVHAAVMPCCQKDLSPGSHWKATSKRLGLSIETTMDLLLAGKCLSWANGTPAHVTYDVRMKLIDASITPQNRVLVCRASARDESQIDNLKVDRAVANAHRRLEGAYRRAHRTRKESFCLGVYRDRYSFVSGLTIGLCSAMILLYCAERRRRM